jgi:hypothetical protein
VSNGSRLVVGVHTVTGRPGVGVGLTGLVGMGVGMGCVVGLVVPVEGVGVVVVVVGVILVWGVVLVGVVPVYELVGVGVLPPRPTMPAAVGDVTEATPPESLPETLLAVACGAAVPLLDFGVAVLPFVVSLALVAVTLSDLLDEDPPLLLVLLLPWPLLPPFQKVLLPVNGAMAKKPATTTPVP